MPIDVPDTVTYTTAAYTGTDIYGATTTTATYTGTITSWYAVGPDGSLYPLSSEEIEVVLKHPYYVRPKQSYTILVAKVLKEKGDEIFVEFVDHKNPMYIGYKQWSNKNDWKKIDVKKTEDILKEWI